MVCHRKSGKDRRHSPWRDNCDKIIHFAAAYVDLDPTQLIFRLFPPPGITRIVIAVGPIPFLSNGSS